MRHFLKFLVLFLLVWPQGLCVCVCVYGRCLLHFLQDAPVTSCAVCVPACGDDITPGNSLSLSSEWVRVCFLKDNSHSVYVEQVGPSVASPDKGVPFQPASLAPPAGQSRAPHLASPHHLYPISTWISLPFRLIKWLQAVAKWLTSFALIHRNWRRCTAQINQERRLPDPAFLRISEDCSVRHMTKETSSATFCFSSHSETSGFISILTLTLWPQAGRSFSWRLIIY